MKMNRVIVMLRDENVDLRAKNVDIQTDYVILDESYKNFITVSNFDESSTSINSNAQTEAEYIGDRQRVRSEGGGIYKIPREISSEQVSSTTKISSEQESRSEKKSEATK